MFEGKVGFGNVMGEGPDWQALLSDWGRRWSTEKILYKPHVSSFCTQALIEGVLELRATHGIHAEQVTAIRGFVSEMSMKNATIVKPKTGMEGKFSLPFAASLALVQGSATKADFCDERAQDPAIENIRSITRISAGDGVKWPQALVEIDTNTGQRFKTFVDLEKRMETPEQKWKVAESKFRQIVKGLLEEDGVNRVVETVSAIDKSPDLSGLIKNISTRLKPR
jgi:2-methylcitrate dehydratase PrpD